MEAKAVPDNLRTQLSDLVAKKIGLLYPPNRWADLQRGVAGAMGELGFADVTSCTQWLLSAPLTKDQLDVLTSNLTIGETYFFREKMTFAALAEKILPELVQARRKVTKRLRIWSAACCTGEEAYSLAILLEQVIPDLSDWFVSILATDINPHYLKKAAAGVYGSWSFRDAPTGFQNRYFKRTNDGRYAIRSRIKKRVTFAQLNLVEDTFPSLVAETNAMDLILCRNVLMYFSPPQAQKVARKLGRALIPNGWLVVSPSEASQTLFSELATVNYPGVILYQKRDSHGSKQRSGSSQPREDLSVAPWISEPRLPETPQLPVSTEPEFHLAPVEPVSDGPKLEPASIATSLYEQGRYAEVVETLLSATNTHTTPDAPTFSLLTRALADQGKLAESLSWSERWIAAHKLDSSGHYLRAIVLQELGELEQACNSLQRVLYLDPQFVLAHFALGNLARSSGKIAEANKHFANASRLLNETEPNDILKESDGLTAGRLSEIISSLIVVEVAP